MIELNSNNNYGNLLASSTTAKGANVNPFADILSSKLDKFDYNLGQPREMTDDNVKEIKSVSPNTLPSNLQVEITHLPGLDDNLKDNVHSYITDLVADFKMDHKLDSSQCQQLSQVLQQAVDLIVQ